MAATRSIQDALAGTVEAAAEAEAATQDRDVIDVDARVIEDHPIGIGATESLRSRSTTREHHEPPREARAPVMDEERFLAATYARGRASIDYKLYVPPGDPSVPRPLLLMLHGCTQNPDDFAIGTRMNEVARRNGWLVLYPGESTRLSPQGCWNWFKTSHQERGRGRAGAARGADASRHGPPPRRCAARARGGPVRRRRDGRRAGADLSGAVRLGRRAFGTAQRRGRQVRPRRSR